MSYPNARDCKHGNKRGKCDLCDMEERIAELERENAELRRDAERYCYAAEHLWIGDVDMGRIVEEWGTIDIDAAIASEKESGNA